MLQYSGAHVGFYKDGCPIHLKGAPVVERPPRKFLHFLYQNGEFLCIPEDIYFIDIVTALMTCFEHMHSLLPN